MCVSMAQAPRFLACRPMAPPFRHRGCIRSPQHQRPHWDRRPQRPSGGLPGWPRCARLRPAAKGYPRPPEALLALDSAAGMRPNACSAARLLGCPRPRCRACPSSRPHSSSAGLPGSRGFRPGPRQHPRHTRHRSRRRQPLHNRRRRRGLYYPRAPSTRCCAPWTARHSPTRSLERSPHCQHEHLRSHALNECAAANQRPAHCTMRAPRRSSGRL
mmetsp:Transcript_70779/g.229952  ORF Transcript_70779/g.229952 Transcript_70779/m.229952 type:complete len:215 (+) Transcript_70779:131-775(+)